MATRTPLFNRVQHGGVWTISDLVKHPGDIWFVHSGTGTDGAAYGQNPDTPCATVDYAIGLATASQGDVIYCLPGHAESFTATNGFDADKAGISIVGLGNGTNRATFTFADTDAQVNIGAAGVTLENLRFLAGIDGVVSGVQIEGKTDATLRNCTWDYSGTTAHDFIIMLELEAGSHRATIEGCKFLTEPAVAGCLAGIQSDGANNWTRIYNNTFMGYFGTACVNQITAISQGLMFVNNLVYNNEAGQTYLEAFSGTTGVIANTRGMAGGATIAENAISDAMAFCENYVANTAGTIPVVKGLGVTAPALDAD